MRHPVGQTFLANSVQGYVKIYMLSSENHPKNVPLLTQKCTVAQYFSQPFQKPFGNVFTLLRIYGNAEDNHLAIFWKSFTSALYIPVMVWRWMGVGLVPSRAMRAGCIWTTTAALPTWRMND